MLPPYTRSDAGSDDGTWYGSEAAVVAVADHRAGFLAIYGADTTDVNGGCGATWAWAWIEMDHVLPEDASFIDYEIALDRTVALGFRVGLRDSIGMSASARSASGLEAGAGAPQGSGPISLSFRLQNPDGAVDAGTITLRVGIFASFSAYGPPLSDLPCTFATVVGEATVRSITAAVHPAPPSEPPNTPPTAAFVHECTDLACSFDATASSDSDGSIVGYAWDFGDGASATGVATDHAYAAEGTYAVTLTVTDDEGATDDESKPVTVSNPPPPNTPPTASFTYACTDLSCDFDGTGSSDAEDTADVLAYSWDFGDGATGAGPAVNHTYTEGGAYLVVLTVMDSRGLSDDESQEVQVSEPPPPEIQLDAHGYKEKGLQKVDLTWTNAASAMIDVVRDDVVIATTENDGAYTDHLDGRGQGSYVYQVCEAGTATCSNQAVVEY